MLLSPKHIQLRNFRGVRALDWHFQDQPGFYFVQGQNLKEPTLGANGAGKSTIFVDAPYWILTGKTIMSQRPGNSIEGWGTERTETYGELTLAIGDEDYVIRRGRNPSVLTINHRTVEQHEIDKLIPLSDSALRRTLLLGQRSLMFLDLRPEEKSRLFSETLDLDIWLRATEIANEDLRKKERQLTQIETQFANVSGSMNEVRNQHETAVQKEAEFARAHETRLAELKRLGADEVQRLDALSKTFAEAQTRLKQIAQSSTSDDELRNHRAAERALRDALIRLDSEQSRAEREAAQLQRQIDAYKAAICPECNQPLLDQAHTHKRREELVIAAQAALRILEQAPTRRDELNSQIAASEQKTLALEEANRAGQQIRIEVEALATQITTQERAVIRTANDLKKAEAEANPFSNLCDELESRYKSLGEQRDSLEQQATTLNQEIEILKFWQKGYRDIRLEQIDATLLELELATNRNASALGLQDWEIQFATERETKSGSVSHAFSIFLFPPGQSKAVSWDSYSGGEAQRWQLAVTFALSEVLLSRAGITPDFEILDEITNHLSDIGVDDLLECLSERAHSLQRRIFLIDHRVLSKGDFDGIISVVKTSEGIGIET